MLHRAGARWHWASETYPADHVSLRTVTTDNFLVIDTTFRDEKQTKKRQIIAEVDWGSAFATIYPKAIYLVESEPYEVQELHFREDEEKVAYVKRVDVDYFTDAVSAKGVWILRRLRGPRAPRLPRRAGRGAGGREGGRLQEDQAWARSRTSAPARSSCPSRRCRRRAPGSRCRPRRSTRVSPSREELIDGLRAVTYLLHHLAPIFLLCDIRDLGSWLGDTTPGRGRRRGDARVDASGACMRRRALQSDHLSLRLARRRHRPRRARVRGPARSARGTGCETLEACACAGRLSLVRRARERGRPPRQGHGRRAPARAHRLSARAARLDDLRRVIRRIETARPPRPAAEPVERGARRRAARTRAQGRSSSSAASIRSTHRHGAESLGDALAMRRSTLLALAPRASSGALDAARRPALPRHRDDRARRRHRHLRVPRRHGARSRATGVVRDPALHARLRRRAGAAGGARAAARAGQRARDVQRRRLRPAAAGDALRAGAPALAGRRCRTSTCCARRAACGRRWLRRLPAGDARARGARPRARGRRAGRADPARSTSTSCARAGPRRCARVFAHNRARRARRSSALLGWFGARAGRPRARCGPRSWPGSGGSGSRWISSAALACYRAALAAGLPERPSHAGRGCVWRGGRSARPAGRRPARCGRPRARHEVFDPRPWEELAKFHEHRARDFAAARAVVEDALGLARAARRCASRGARGVCALTVSTGSDRRLGAPTLRALREPRPARPRSSRSASAPTCCTRCDASRASVWPPTMEYVHHDPVCQRHWGALYREFARSSRAVRSSRRVVAAGFTIPLAWSGRRATLPSGVDGALERGVRDRHVAVRRRRSRRCWRPSPRTCRAAAQRAPSIRAMRRSRRGTDCSALDRPRASDAQASLSD